MKFTRMFVLRMLNQEPFDTDTESQNNNTNNIFTETNSNKSSFHSFKELIITNSNIDFIIHLILSFLSIITSSNYDYEYIYHNPFNIYLLIKVSFTVTLLYLFIDIICIILSHFFNQTIPPPLSFQFQSQSNRNSTASHKDETLLPNVTPVIHFKLPSHVQHYWHTYNAVFHLFKTILFIQSFALSIFFWIVYSSHKSNMSTLNYFFVHIIILELFQFYCLFRFCFFILKVLFNFTLIPMYIAAVYLGYVEDNFNHQLNAMVNTVEYTGRLSLRKVDNNERKSELEETCIICLNSFQLGDIVSTLPCNKRHMFHTYCLEKWFYKKVSCPFCRVNFNEELRELLPLNFESNPNDNNNNDTHIFIQMVDMNDNNNNNPHGRNNNNNE